MKLIKLSLDGDRGTIYLNPSHIVAVRKNHGGALVITDGRDGTGMSLEYIVTASPEDVAKQVEASSK